MKRYAILFGCFAILASPALATSAFNKQWKEKYLSGDDVDKEFVKTARKHGCYICHVVKEDKKKVRNEYGKAIHEFLDAEKFTKEYIKENPEKAAEEMNKGFAEAGKKKSKSGETFAAKIEAGEVPAVDSGKD